MADKKRQWVVEYTDSDGQIKQTKPYDSITEAQFGKQIRENGFNRVSIKVYENDQHNQEG